MGLIEEGRLHQVRMQRARHFVALLVEEAQRQGCLQEIALFRDHFVLWAVLSSPLLGRKLRRGRNHQPARHFPVGR